MRLFYPSFFLLATPNLHRADFSSAPRHGAPPPATPAPGTENPPQQTDSNPSTASSPAAPPPPRHAHRPRALPHPAPLRAAPPRRRDVPPCRLLRSAGRSGLAPRGTLEYRQHTALLGPRAVLLSRSEDSDEQKAAPCLASHCRTCYNDLMVSSLHGDQGWRVYTAVVAEKSIEVKLGIDRRYKFLCPHCSAMLIKHSLREIYMQALPIKGRQVTLHAEVY